MNEKDIHELIIIGGGVSGQLAKKYFASMNPIIVSKGECSDSALFRSKSASIPLMLGVEAKEVSVSKFIVNDGIVRQTLTPKDINRYSVKVCGKICRRSICDVSNEISKRYVFSVPRNFDIEDYVTCITRCIGFTLIELASGQTLMAKNIISTIPMPSLIKIVRCNIGVKMDCVKFNSSEITVARFDVSIPIIGDWQQTIYFPGNETHCYRATMNNSGIIAEFVEGTNDEIVKAESVMIAAAFGVSAANVVGRKIHFMKHGKIIDGKASRDRMIIMSRLTKELNLYSLGRYATWNESSKTEKLVDDLAKIRSMMLMSEEEKEYNRMKI